MMKHMKLLLLASTALVPLATLPVLANPLDGTVVAGSASIDGSGTGTVTITQSTDKAIIDWNTFDIGNGEITTFVQPSISSVVLNRVTGGLGPSEIIGSLVANGQVYLVNRDGILFGKDAVIDTGALVATTFDILDQDFLDGDYRFDFPGNSAASVINLGVITVDDGGFAALVAPGVRNDGVIAARLGKIALGSGDGFTLDLYGDSLIKLTLSDEVSGEIIDVATGETLKSLVSNGGLLSADGGTVLLTAASTRAIVDSIINNTGNIEANSVGLKNGKIVLGADTVDTKGADAPTQKVKVSGTISATGAEAGETGGTVEITGEQIELLVATIDAFGWNGGGTVLIGGDVGGGAPNRAVVSDAEVALADYALGNATTVTVSTGTVINASATDQGDGGKVIVWSDEATDFAGTILGRGGRLGGDGGFVETSGDDTLAFTGTVDTSAPLGTDGTLLLDPLNVTIGTIGPHTITPAAIVAALATNNVKVTTGTTGAEVGDITVAEAITWSNANALTLSAARSIAVNAAITNASGADIKLRADDTGNGVGTVSFSAGGSITTTGDVALYYNPSVNPAGSGLNGSSYVAAIESFVPYVTAGSFNPYMFVNTINDLQNITNNQYGTYALGKDINAQGFSWNPIFEFYGTLDGDGHEISGLHANADGIFGFIYPSAVVTNLYVTDAVVGGNYGGIIANANFGEISDVHVAGTVTTALGGGGIVYQNSGLILRSSADVSIDSKIAGGIAAINVPMIGSPATISQSFTTGTVIIESGGSYPYGGGIAGFVNSNSADLATITDSYAGVDVFGGAAGGLVGVLSSNSAANGSVGTSYSYGYPYQLVGAINPGGSVVSSYSYVSPPSSLPAGFDPSIWGIDPSYNDGYPYLLWQRTAAAVETILAPIDDTPPPPPPPPPPDPTYTISGVGSVLTLADIAGHSFPFGTMFVQSGTGTIFTAEQLGGTTDPLTVFYPAPKSTGMDTTIAQTTTRVALPSPPAPTITPEAAKAVLPFAEMSAAAYGSSNINWSGILAKRGYAAETDSAVLFASNSDLAKRAELANFYAVVFVNDITREIVVSFRGTVAFVGSQSSLPSGQSWKLLPGQDPFSNTSVWWDERDYEQNIVARAGLIPESYKLAAEMLHEVIDTYTGPQSPYTRYTVITTGHSLGGGEASYAAGQEDVQSYTFNAARNRASDSNEGSQQVNVITAGDAVGDADAGWTAKMAGSGALSGTTYQVAAPTIDFGLHDIKGVVDSLLLAGRA